MDVRCAMPSERAVEAGFEPSYRVLVVDDDEQTSHLLRFMLEREGYSVIVARNGRDAQEAIASLPPVDLILLDLMLPYVSGYQIIIDTRNDPDWSRVPILVVSGRSLEMDVVRALDMGATDFVAKPFRPEELHARIRRIIAASKVGGAA